MNIIPQSATLLSLTPDAMALIERAGRVCWRSEPQGDPAAFGRMLLTRGHESVIEHASATFLLVTDRGVTHELVRHRIASFSQESTRYVDMAKRGVDVVVPPGMDAFARDDWAVAMGHAERAYHSLRGRGCPPEIARSVLPTCLATRITVTANLREWRHIIRLRCAKAAHPQIRELMGMVRDALAREVPVLMEGL